MGCGMRNKEECRIKFLDTTLCYVGDIQNF